MANKSENLNFDDKLISSQDNDLVNRERIIELLSTQPLSLRRVFELFKPTVTAAPTHIPKSVYEQIVPAFISSEARLYWYDVTNNVWRYSSAGISDHGALTGLSDDDHSAYVLTDTFFGDGSDGTVTISVNTTLTRDMFYNSLTVNSGITLNPGSFKIFVKGTLTNNGTIARNGNAGGNGGNGGDASGNGAQGTGGTSGTAGAALADGTIKGAFAGAAGGTGGQAASGASDNGDAGGNGTNETKGFQNNNGASGGSGGNGGGVSGGGGRGEGGAAGTAGTNTRVTLIAEPVMANILSTGGTFLGPAPGSSAGGGGGSGQAGGSFAAGGGGGGGGAGSAGGIVLIFAKTITNNGGAVIRANGGQGGNGGNGGTATGATNNCGGGGGGAGSGGQGGAVILVYNSLTNNGTIEALNGGNGTAGTKGGGVTGGSPADGNTASGTANGSVIQITIT